MTWKFRKIVKASIHRGLEFKMLKSFRFLFLLCFVFKQLQITLKDCEIKECLQWFEKK